MLRKGSYDNTLFYWSKKALHIFSWTKKGLSKAVTATRHKGIKA
jgi:hypothetical protein